MNKKHIWIINEYAGSPKHGMEFRHFYLAKEFTKEGYETTIVSSSYSHLFKIKPERKQEIIDGINYRWLKTLNYGNSHNKKRVLKWFIFMLKCFFLPFILKKPDVIIVSPMAPFPILPAWMISKIFNAKLIYEVKDIWPLSLIELGGFSEKHPFIKIMAWFEKFALKKSDKIVSNLQNYGEHIREIGIERSFEWISNGVDLDEFHQTKTIDDEMQREIPVDKFIVGYAGTVGVANALDTFLEASKYVESEIVFVVVGNGQEKKRLINIYKDNSNVLFLDSVAKRQVQSLISSFDVCYIGLKKERLFKYGVSPNKLFDYMFSEKSILYAIDSGENVVDFYNCGIVVEAENPKEIAKGIQKLFEMSEEQRDKLGQNGKKAVLENFTYEKLAKKYIKILESL